MPDDTEERTIKVRRVDFYPTEWLEGTIGLTHLERSVYITVCAAIYANGGPVEARHARQLCPGRDFNKGLGGLVAKGKVSRDGNAIVQRRCAIECAKATRRIRGARTNGATGGRPINGLAKPNGSTNKKANLPTYNHKKDSSSSSLPSSARAPLPDGGAEHARGDENGAWRKLGATALPPPAPPTADKVKRAGEHYFFLINHGRPGEAERYLDCLDVYSQLPPDEIFNAVEARMSA